MTGDAHPTQPLPDSAAPSMPPGHAAPRTRRRRGVVWIVVTAIVALLAVAAWFIGEAVARNIVVDTVRQRIITELALPQDQQIDVALEGAVLPQLIGGALTSIRISSDDVRQGDFSAAVVVEAHDVPIRGDGEMRDAHAIISLDEAQLRQLLSAVDGFPVDTVGIDAPDITATTELSLFGAKIPVGLSLTPRAEEGELVLTPTSVQVAGSDITVDELRRQFGIVSNAVLRDWPVCIAEYLPRGLTLADVTVEDDRLRAGFDVDDRLLVDDALLADGSCA